LAEAFLGGGDLFGQGARRAASLGGGLFGGVIHDGRSIRGVAHVAPAVEARRLRGDYAVEARARHASATAIRRHPNALAIRNSRKPEKHGQPTTTARKYASHTTYRQRCMRLKAKPLMRQEKRRMRSSKIIVRTHETDNGRDRNMCGKNCREINRLGASLASVCGNMR
jgi:hypothetical protein